MTNLKFIFSTTGNFIREYAGFYSRSHYLLINDLGLFYFTISPKKANLIISLLLKDKEDFPHCLDTFIDQLNSHPRYLGQPLTILVGGSFSFYKIDSADRGGIKELQKYFDWLDWEETKFKFRYIRKPNGERIIYYGGISKSIYETLISKFQKANLPILDFLPLSLFTLEKWFELKGDGSAALKFPGQEIWLLNRKNTALLEKTHDKIFIGNFILADLVTKSELLSDFEIKSLQFYSTFENDIHSSKGIIRPIGPFIRRLHYWAMARKAFFDITNNGNRLGALLPLSNGLRAAALIVTTIALLSLIALLPVDIYGTRYRAIIDRHQGEYVRKEVLQSEISNFEAKLKTEDPTNQSPKVLAAAIAAFCQKRPTNLYLKEININHDQNGHWFLNADGFCEKESGVFQYRDQVAQYIKDYPLDITFLKQATANFQNSISPKDPPYGFRMKLTLGNSHE